MIHPFCPSIEFGTRTLIKFPTMILGNGIPIPPYTQIFEFVLSLDMSSSEAGDTQKFLTRASEILRISLKGSIYNFSSVSGSNRIKFYFLPIKTHTIFILIKS